MSHDETSSCLDVVENIHFARLASKLDSSATDQTFGAHAPSAKLASHVQVSLMSLNV
jgi:hypothetical protein